MYIVRFGIMYPYYQYAGLKLMLSEIYFALLVLSVVLISAAGYITNDFFDINTDSINHPNSVVIGVKISKKRAMLLSNIFNFIGILLGFICSYHINYPKFVIIYLLIVSTLWLYPWFFKKMLLIGNIIISALVAIIPFFPFLYEIAITNPIIQKYPTKDINIAFANMFLFVAGFSFFAFFLTLLREIIKDNADFLGDYSINRRTVPVVFGIKTAKIISVVIIFFIILSLFAANFYFLRDITSLLYLTTFVIVPLVIISYKIKKAQNAKDFYKISNILKIIMLLGISYAIIIPFKV
ncbi:MAG: geranylgeranylglycerol-phosphate geranylgeranyltransferase [Bacteroidales bacterium]|nr:geranylgeranylglycerol-phosphate geranylgeranyltransferase [Bacteroidales bacterium]